MKSFSIFFGTAILISSLYLGTAWWGYSVVGFPLDDSWIHQTYARNLAETGQLAFVPGLPSAGSTAPLWSFWLSLGYLLHAPFLAWAYGSGAVLLGLIGWTISRLTRHLFPEQTTLGLWIGLFCVLEWHLGWAAVSGMETLLFIWLSLLLLERYCSYQSTLTARESLTVGLIGGLLILTRPEGIGLVGLMGLDVARRHLLGQTQSTHQDSHRRGASEVVSTGSTGIVRGFGVTALLVRWGLITLGSALLIAPYVAFHFSLTGRPFPSTFYAKQAEYGFVLEQYPLWWRLFGNLTTPVEAVRGVFQVIFIGPQLLLLPGLLFALWLTFRERRANLGIIWLWWISFLILYGTRLPMTYQHGRYQMPILVWVILLGLWGSSRLWGWYGAAAAKQLGLRQTTTRLTRLVSRVVLISLLGVTVAFVGLGANSYGRDVRFIDSEMVTVGRWLDRNIPSDATIAAHDIGGIGYFAQRRLLDLAGLVTPEVIPIINDEAALLDFILTRQADYLVTFPSWYPQMTRSDRLRPIYCTVAGLPFDVCTDHMVVYEVIK